MTNSSEVETMAIQPHKLLILDARSYAAAVANRAKGGGCECPGRPRLFSVYSGFSSSFCILISSFCFPNFDVFICPVLKNTIPTVRWCSWAWPTSTPYARVSSPYVSSAHRCRIQQSTVVLVTFLSPYCVKPQTPTSSAYLSSASILSPNLLPSLNQSYITPVRI